MPGQQLSDDESSNSSEPERSILVENSEAENDPKNVSSKSLAEDNFMNASQKFESSSIDDESSMDDWSEEETVGDVQNVPRNMKAQFLHGELTI